MYAKFKYFWFCNYSLPWATSGPETLLVCWIDIFSLRLSVSNLYSIIHRGVQGFAVDSVFTVLDAVDQPIISFMLVHILET